MTKVEIGWMFEEMIRNTEPSLESVLMDWAIECQTDGEHFTFMIRHVDSKDEELDLKLFEKLNAVADVSGIRLVALRFEDGRYIIRGVREE